MVSPVQQIEALAARLEKARQLVADGKVHPITGMDDHYIVQGSAGYYLVNAVCACQDAQHRSEIHKGWCKHKLAVEIFKETPKGEKPKAGRKAKASANGTTPAEDRSIDEKVADLYPTQKEESAPAS
jgi:predicted nucleic acid-binding Zn finger protein